MVVAEHALKVGARVFIEWPRQCKYWSDKRVVKFLTKRRFVNADFDGCMYGLVAQKGPASGTPIKKPWRVACSPGSSLPRFLNRTCDGSHEHTPCAGANTLSTQGYTDEICALVHQSIRHDLGRLGRASAKGPKIEVALVAIASPECNGARQSRGKAAPAVCAVVDVPVTRSAPALCCRPPCFNSVDEQGEFTISCRPAGGEARPPAAALARPSTSLSPTVEVSLGLDRGGSVSTASSHPVQSNIMMDLAALECGVRQRGVPQPPSGVALHTGHERHFVLLTVLTTAHRTTASPCRDEEGIGASRTVPAPRAGAVGGAHQ